MLYVDLSLELSMTKRSRGEVMARADATTHVEDCAGCEDFAEAHEKFALCGVCMLGGEKSGHTDVVTQKDVCKDCWDKTGRDPIEVARRISGRTESLDFDHGRILSADAA